MANFYLALILLLLSFCACFAQATEGGDPSASTVLKGGVRGAALLTEDGLKKIGATSGSLESSAMRVFGEANRKDTITVRGPNVINGSVIIPAIPNPSGTMQFGQLPPREKFMRSFMNQIAYNVELLQNEIDALILPDNKSPQLEQAWSQIRASMDQVQAHLAELKSLTEGTKYDTDRISREASGVYQGARKIDKLRKDVEKLLKQQP